MKKKIKFLIMDVDGTLTDGKVYMGTNGELFKVFNIKDGCGIKDVLPQYSIVPIIITARSSEALSIRCRELNILDVYQNIRNKLEKLDEILLTYSKADNANYTYKDCAYIGDDILDLQCMVPILNAGGLVGCPADAVKEVKTTADFVCQKAGGEGAVREFIEWIVDS